MLCLQAQKTYKFNLILLDNRTLECKFKGAQKCQQLIVATKKFLRLNELEYFGFKLLVDKEKRLFKWIDPTKTIDRQFRQHSTSNDIVNKQTHIGSCPSIDLYLSVKYYPTDPCKLVNEQTRYLLYLQLRKDILDGSLSVPFEISIDLFAYILQAELGDFDATEMSEAYYSSAIEFVPNQSTNLEVAAESKHKKLKGMSNDTAEFNFLNKVKWLDMYGVCMKRVLDENEQEYSIGLTPTGISVYKNDQKIESYFWPRIAKLNCKSNKLILSVIDKMNEQKSQIYTLDSESASKSLWKECLDHYNFFRIKSIYKEPPKIRTSAAMSKSNSTKSIGSNKENFKRMPTNRVARRVVTQEEKDKIQKDSSDEKSLATKLFTSPHAKCRRESASESEFGSRNKHHRQRSRNRSRSRRENETDEIKLVKPTTDSETNENGTKHVVVRRNRSTSKGPGRQRSKSRRRSNSSIKYIHDPSETGHETSLDENDPVNDAERKRQIRRRKRSKSPGGTTKPPEEILQHIKYNMVESNGMSQAELQEIPFVKIETTAPAFRVSPHQKHRRISPRRRKSQDLNESKSSIAYLTNGTAHIVKTNKPGSEKDAFLVMPAKANLITINTATANKVKLNNLTDATTSGFSADSGCEDVNSKSKYVNLLQAKSVML